MATLVALAAGCSDRDHTEVCVGPGCPSYDGIAGEHSGGTSGVGGTAGTSGTGGTGGSPDGGIDPLPDAGADANPPPEPCEVVFVTPNDANGAVTLSEADDVDADACGAQFTTGVVLDSNAATLNLFVNGSPLGEQVVADGSAEFQAVLGNRGSTNNVLRADAVMADGRTCSVTFASDLLVDCPGPSCSIESPVANEGGYLNASQDDDTNTADLQADIVIGTEAEHDGEPVRLEIDAVFDSVAAVDVGADGKATFTAVTLEEGPRTVRAECRDAAGVVTLSPPVEWNVDITACGLSIDSVAGDADPVTRLQDFDNNPSNGLQVEVAGDITGADCDVVHVGECDGDDIDVDVAENAGDFSGFVTLGNETGTVSVCASIDDLAGNPSPNEQVNVNVRAADPAVAISSPLNGARVNLSGTSGALADGNPLTTATCETDVVVDCTDVGEPVQLLLGASVVATEACVAQGGLDAPFLGRASFSSVSLPTRNDGVSATLSARQTVAGLEGASTNVLVQADCEAPSCDITAPAASEFLNAADDSSGDAGFQVDFSVQTGASEVGQSIVLLIDGDESGSSSAEAGGGGAVAAFADVTLAEGSRDAQARCSDAAGNIETSDIETWVVDATPCTTTLVVAGGANPVTPLDDTDALSAGLQVPATGQTVGTDCDAVRVGICDALSGSASALAGDGSFALATTLASVTGSVNVCAEVSDLAGNLGVQTTSVNVDVDGPSLTIESPLDQAVFNSNSTDCDAGTAGLQITVSGLTDAEEGSAVEVQLGVGASSEVAVATGAYTACVEAPQGNDQTLTATVLDDLTGLEATASIVVSVDTTPPGAIGPLTVDVTGRRQGTLNVSWASVLDTDGDPLAAYQLRCATTDITDELTWAAATNIPVAFTPSTSAGTTETVGLTGFRTGTSRFCVVRGLDDNGQLSPISLGLTSVVANPFLQQTYTIRDDANNINTVGNVVVEPLGDVNGDTIDDFMYGALNANLGGAQVFFGSTTLNPLVAETADITINRTGTASGFGGEATGLGDISGDGIPDFAVSARLPANNTVYVFFGREDADPDFDAVIDAAGAACPVGVDLCVVGTAVPTNGGLFSWDVHGANFDGSGVNDLVISARTANSVVLGAGRVYVLLGGAQLATATNRIVTIPANAVTTLDEVDGFIIDPPASRAHFGFSVTALDGTGTDDLIIGANGQPAAGTAAPVGAVYHLTGRAYPATAGSGLISIASSELSEIETGLVANFGNPVRAVGDFNGDGAGDFAMGHNYTSFGAVRVYLRSGVGGTFSSSSVLNFLPLGDGNDDNYGLYMANGEYPGLGVIGDLDNDGTSELLIGADDPDTAAACPGGAEKGVAQLFYGAEGAVARPRADADFSYTATVGQVVPNFVGDINQDGFKDFALLDSGCGTNALFLMY